jgi:hypothetical protein
LREMIGTRFRTWAVGVAVTVTALVGAAAPAAAAPAGDVAPLMYVDWGVNPTRAVCEVKGASLLVRGEIDGYRCRAVLRGWGIGWHLDAWL